ncbi:MAG: L-threonylcarbamoyladenylate synthase [Candidatus Rifleibacteriota bacterium]
MKRIKIENLLTDPELLEKFVSDLEAGAAAIIPTDTLYGIAVDGNLPEAVTKVYEIKNRDARKPLILFLNNFEELKSFKISPDMKQNKILKKYWPGALTAIFPFCFPQKLAGFTHPTIGIRIPDHYFLLQLLQKYPGNLLTTSANRSGLPSDPDPENLFNEFKNEIEWLIEDGVLPEAIPSTVVDMSGQNYKVLRQGSIKLDL